jgi:serine/threonine protein kinase
MKPWPIHVVTSRALRDFARTVTRPLRLRLPGVEEVLGFCLERGVHPPLHGTVITEYAPHGPLSDVLQNLWRRVETPGFGPTEKSKCIFGVAFIMKRLHELGKMHPDLTHKSILLDSNFEPLITDLGSVKAGSRRRRKADLGATPTLTSQSPVFTAPEVEDDDSGPCLESNIFSFAILIYMFFAQLPPPSGRRQGWTQFQLAQHYTSARWPRPPGIPMFLWELVQDCWDTGPDIRRPFAVIVENLNDSDAWKFPGTDEAQFREYQTRIARAVPEQPRSKELSRALSEVCEFDRLILENKSKQA